jgi:hypothetical protein
MTSSLNRFPDLRLGLSAGVGETLCGGKCRAVEKPHKTQVNSITTKRSAAKWIRRARQLSVLMKGNKY